MKLFIAVNFDKETKQRIEEVKEKLKNEASGGKFSLQENFHLTLVFLGETAEERLPEINDAMEQAVYPEGSRFHSFDLSFSNVHFFKRSGKELWYLGIEEKNHAGEKLLKELQSRIASELRSRNFLIDKRPYNAHITLGREIKNGPWPFKTESITIKVSRISLMLSEQVRRPDRKNTLVYTELSGYNLARENII